MEGGGGGGRGENGNILTLLSSNPLVLRHTAVRAGSHTLVEPYLYALRHHYNNMEKRWYWNRVTCRECVLQAPCL